MLADSSTKSLTMTAPKSVLPPSKQRQRLRLLEEYLVEYWDQPLDIEAMALVGHVSARSVFRYFREVQGCSPRQFFRQVRMQRARDELAKGESGATIIAVALRCGFSSLGHFAHEYQAAFGELPSATLSRHSLERFID
jgi:AraC-like DNA-binding protein